MLKILLLLQAIDCLPQIISDDAEHAACAVQIATEIMVDLYTFLRPPALSHQLFILWAPEAAPPQETCVERK